MAPPPVFTLDPADALDAAQAPASPLVFASPHSGDVYPDDLGARSGLAALSLRSAEDALVNRLVAPNPEQGVPLIAARLGRAYVDLNRDPGELDPQVVESGGVASPRVVAGFGVIPRLTGDGQTIRDHALTHEEALARLAWAHRPYHEALERLMHRARDRFGFAVLVDWHSMPSRAVGRPAGVRGPDVVLGDRHGSACSAEVTRLLRGLFERPGWRVALNRPYAGGWSTQLWGRPAEGFHAVQVELNRALYLDEETLEPGPHFAMTQKVIGRVTVAMAAYDWSGLRPHAQAAE
ncbi:MAG: N-formylglutamate amidohydrolase [Brevundimonas sp.]|uniref:N-formylglutamate amidohydrolase n=1 Tax=Brevundimonas sp. TaxID=1871086 RepID=UPI00391C547D